MPPFGSQLSDDEIEALVQYLTGSNGSSETTTSQSHASQHASHEPPRRRHWLLAAGWPRAAWMTVFFLLGMGIVVGLRALGGYEPGARLDIR